MRGASQQVMLDSLTRSLVACTEDGDWARCVSDRGFAQARDQLSWGCLERLNAFVVKSADALGLVPRWQGLRLVAADASVLMPAIRAVSHHQTFGQCRSAFVCAVFTRR